MKKRKLIYIAIIGIGIAILCAGCNESETNPNVTAGMEAIEALEYDAAQEDFKEALVAGEDERLIYRGQGLAYMGSMDYEDAITSFEKCLSISSCLVDSLDYDVNYYLATAYEKNNQPEEAETIYDTILQLRPQDTEARYLHGIVLLEQNEAEAAESDFEKVISQEPSDYDMLLSIYEELDEYGYGEIGQEYLQTALDNKTDSMSDYDTGRIYYYLEDYEDARTYLETANEAGVEGAAYYLGKSWEALGEYNYAASVYQNYLQEQGESATIYNELALCEMQLEDYDDALEAIQNGLNLDDSDMTQTLQFNQIVIYEYQGDFSQAAELMETYVSSYPDDADAAREYEFLQTRS